MYREEKSSHMAIARWKQLSIYHLARERKKKEIKLIFHFICTRTKSKQAETLGKAVAKSEN